MLPTPTGDPSACASKPERQAVVGGCVQGAEQSSTRTCSRPRAHFSLSVFLGRPLSSPSLELPKEPADHAGPRPADLETSSITQESQFLTSTPSLSGESENHQHVRIRDPIVPPRNVFHDTFTLQHCTHTHLMPEAVGGDSLWEQGRRTGKHLTLMSHTKNLMKSCIQP